MGPGGEEHVAPALQASEVSSRLRPWTGFRCGTFVEMSRALILGGTGLVGRATARRLLAAGWQVDLTGRDPAHMPSEISAAGGTFIAADRADQSQLVAAMGAGADLLVDCICFTGDASFLNTIFSIRSSTGR